MKKISTSLAEFAQIIENKYIYVDKTKYLYEIVKKDKYYFFSRPRRFGGYAKIKVSQADIRY